MSASFISPMQSQKPLGDFHSRKFLLHNQPQAPAIPPAQTSGKFDSDVVIILSVLLCAVICLVGLFSIIKCAFRCSGSEDSESGSGPSSKLANSGVEKKALKAFPKVKYTPDLKLPGLDGACVICLSEFANGELVRSLPKCNHGFHVRCIDKWLTSHSSCPTCRNSLVEEAQVTVTVQENL